MSNILVVGEHLNGKLRKVTLSTVTFAKEAAKVTGGQVYVALLGHNISAAVEQAAKSGADKVFFEDNAVFANYLAETYAPGIANIAKESGSTIICGPSSTFGKDLLPRIAGKLNAGMVSDAIKVWDDGGMKFDPPLSTGHVITTVEVTTPTKVISVRTTEFDALPESGPCPTAAFTTGVAPVDNAQFVNFDQVKSERPELTDAAVIVAGGRGLKSGENFGMIAELADLLGGAVGASRAAVDSGYAPNDWQIGQTGKVVAPNLYFAVAISGAIQHLAGMKGSKCIVAINKDGDAPIFQVADYGLVADAFQVVPELTQKLKAAGVGQ